MQIITDRPILIGAKTYLPGETINLDDRDAKDLIDRGVAYPAHLKNIAETADRTIAGLVSCIMPTRNRREFVPRAIECFLAQTYALRELVILDNGESVADLIPKDDRIRYIRMAAKSTTGQLRNLCCQVARGEFIAHWDDDDWSHPERLAEQVAAIEGYQATGYNSIYFHGPGKNEVHRYEGAKAYALGTSLFYRRAWWDKTRFPALLVGEDNEFVRRSTGVMKFLDGSSRIVARTHKTNTSPRIAQSSEWKKATVSDLPKGYTA